MCKNGKKKIWREAIFILLFAVICNFMYAVNQNYTGAGEQDYSLEWKKGAAFMKQGKPQSAIVVYDTIFNRARKGGDYLQMAEAFNAKVGARLSINWKYKDSLEAELGREFPCFTTKQGRLIFYLNLYELANKYETIYYIIAPWRGDDYIIKHINKQVFSTQKLKDFAVKNMLLATDRKVLDKIFLLISSTDKNYLPAKCALIRSTYLYSNKEEVFKCALKRADSLMACYPNSKSLNVVRQLKGDIIYELARYEKDNDVQNKLLLQALKICSPVTRDKIRAPYFMSHQKDNAYPGEEFAIPYKCKCLKSLSVKLYRADIMHPDNNKLLKKWEIHPLQNRYCHQDDTLIFKIDSIGLYKIAMEYNDLDNKVYKESNYINVSRIAPVIRRLDSVPYLYVADYLSGKPIKNVDIEIVNVKDSIKREIDAFSLCGFTRLPALPNNGEYSNHSGIWVKCGNDIYSKTIALSSGDFYTRRDERDTVRKTSLFTDRNLYKQGDTILFKGISYSYNLSNVLEVNSSRKLKVYFSAGSGYSKNKFLDSVMVETNSFGSFAGKIVIPQQLAGGRYSLFVYPNMPVYFRIEKYIKDDYVIDLEYPKIAFGCGDTVLQKIKVTTTAGLPVSDGVIFATTTDYKITDTLYLNEKGEAFYNVCIGNSGDFLLRTQYKCSNGRIYNAEMYYDINSVSPVIMKSDLTDVVVSNTSPDYSVTLMNNFRVPLNEEIKYYLSRSKDTLPENIVAKGIMQSQENIPVKWGDVKSGKYTFFATYNYGKKACLLQKAIVVLNEWETSYSWGDNDLLTDLNRKAVGDSIVFVFGAKTKTYLNLDLYTQVTPNAKAKVVFSKAYELKAGLHRIAVEYQKEWLDNIIANISYIKNGEFSSKELDYSRLKRDGILDVQLDIGSSSLPPDSLQTVVIKVTDAQGRGAEAEVILCAFDRTTQRYYNHSFMINRDRPYSYIVDNYANNHNYGNRPYEFRKQGWNTSGLANGIMIRGVSNLMIMEEQEIPFATHKAYNDSEQLTINNTPDKNIRTNLNPTALFLPFIRTDKNGNAVVKFKAPQLLGEFKVLSAAHNKNMDIGFASGKFYSVKDVTVIPNVPAFLREGDKLDYRIGVAAKDSSKLSGKIYIHNLSVKRAVPQWGSLGSVFPLQLPDSLRKVRIVSGFVGKEKDSQLNEFPVYSDNLSLVKSLTRPLTDPGIYKIDISALCKEKNAVNSKITWEVASPMQMAVNALEYMGHSPSNNLISLINASYANIVFLKIHQPGIEFENSLRELKTALAPFVNKDNGFAWYNGMESSIEVTLYFLERMAQLRNFVDLKDRSNLLKEFTDKALLYADTYFTNSQKKIQQEYLSLYYAYVRSYYLNSPFTKTAKKEFEAICRQGIKNWGEYSVLNKALLCRIMVNKGGEDKQRGLEMVQSLMEYSVKDSELGIYYPNLVMPFRGLLSSEIKGHAMLLHLFSDLKNVEMVTGLQQWLLHQKKNQQWENNVATADAVDALLKSSALSGNPLSVEYDVTGIKDSKLLIHKTGQGLLFVNVFNTFEQKSKDVKAFDNGIKIERTFWLKKGDSYVELDSSAPMNLKMGDEVKVKYKINNSQIRSFVQIKGNRAACFVPVSTLSGFLGFSFRNHFMGHYRDVREDCTLFMFNTLPDGITEIEENLYVSYTGSFNCSVAFAECLYAPEYRANTGSKMMEVSQ